MDFSLATPDGIRTVELRDGSSLLVGRAPTSDVPVMDSTVSRRHAELWVENGGVFVRDLGSSNGTYLNGARVTEGRARSGDALRFGRVEFRVQAAATMAETTTMVGARPRPPREGAFTVVRPLAPLGAPMPIPGGAARIAAERREVALLEVVTSLSTAGGVDAVLERVARLSLQMFDAERAAVFVLREGELKCAAAASREGKVDGDDIPRSVARAAIDQRAALAADDAVGDARVSGESVIAQNVRSALAVPLIVDDGEPFGALHLDSRLTARRYDERDVEFATAFAAVAAAAVASSRAAERLRQEAVARESFGRYFAPEVAARIAADPNAARPGGDRRPVAVLFSDLRGFTALAERMAPDDVAALLSEYFGEMTECVFRNGGTLDKFMGDAVMAQWGAPACNADDPVRAVTAALEMVASLAAMNARWAVAGRPQLGVGVGLNYGEAFAGNIGSERRLEFTVIGDTVNTAARLCRSAEAGEVLVTESVRLALAQAGADIRLEPRTPLALKGKADLVPVFRATTSA